MIAGPGGAAGQGAKNAIAAAIAGDATTVRADAAAMRARMLRELPPDGPWDVKPRPGGQIEVEFIAQVLQLRHAETMPEVLSPTTRVALRALAEAGVLAEDDAALLIRADHSWRTVQGMLRITVGRDAGEALPEASALLAAPGDWTRQILARRCAGNWRRSRWWPARPSSGTWARSDPDRRPTLGED